MKSQSLKNKAVNGVYWSAIDRFASQGISFVISIVIARLLSPHDYGLMAMVAIFISISQAFIDSGLSSAIVRKTDRTQKDLSTAFYTNVIIGLFCYIILFFTAPLIADFYEEKDLISIVRVMGIIFFLFSFSNIQQAVLTIKLDFKTKTKISLLSVLLSGTLGVIIAYKGLGVWALIIQQVTFALFRTTLLWAYVKWKPLLTFSYQSFKELFSFGSKILITSLLNSIFNNLYTIVIGKLFSASSLGFYSRAEQFAQFPSSNITNIIKGVTFPTMAVIQDEENRFKANFYKIQKIITFIIFPLILGLATVASPLVFILLSDKWMFSAKLLQIICLALMWYPIYTQNLNLLEVKGHSSYILASEAMSKILSIGLLFLLLPNGIIAVCWGQVFANIINVLISTYFVKKVIQDSYYRLFSVIAMNLITSVVMAMICFVIKGFIKVPFFQLSACIIIGGLIYVILHYLFNRTYLMMFINLILKK